MHRTLRNSCVALALLAGGAWACTAVYFGAPGAVAAPLAAFLAVAFLGLAVRVRPFARAAVACAALFAVVLGWWLSLAPSNERDWLPDVERTTTATIEGDRVTVHDLRNFEYRSETDYTARWETREYDLAKLEGADIFLSYWGSPWIAHTIMSWTFTEGPPLAISIETRKERGEEYSSIRGFFRQYELYYVVADERDVVRLRTNHRGEDVYLYPLIATPETARAVLLDYLEEINRLAQRPRWYNALTHNCTTVIRHHIQNVGSGNPWNWRILVNGRIDELGYLRGTVNNELPFAELRSRSNVVARARAADAAEDFSLRIRAGLPYARSDPRRRGALPAPGSPP